jgi:hypothetical protein
MMAAARLLLKACSLIAAAGTARVSSTCILEDTDTVAHIASAVSSLGKRVAACVNAAGRQQNEALPDPDSYSWSEHCFAAAVPPVLLLVGEIARLVQDWCNAFKSEATAALGATDGSCNRNGSSSSGSGSTSGSSGGSSESSGSSSTAAASLVSVQQCRASAALLAAVLAGALVAIVDALHSAAAAAGVTPQQLLAR